jgi:hypothetical protein
MDQTNKIMGILVDKTKLTYAEPLAGRKGDDVVAFHKLARLIQEPIAPAVSVNQ